DQEGWPFGRAVYISEASGVLERVPLVDYVENVQITAPDEPDRTQRDSSGQAVAVVLDANELVSLQATSLVAYDVRGQRYEEAAKGMDTQQPQSSATDTQPQGSGTDIQPQGSGTDIQPQGNGTDTQQPQSSYLGYLPAIFRQEPFLGSFLLAFETVLNGTDS